MKLLYFAWLRERIGVAEDDIDPPADIVTISDLMTWLAKRGCGYAHAFENASVVRSAIDKTHVQPSALIEGAREIAFFPPMTGG